MMKTHVDLDTDQIMHCHNKSSFRVRSLSHAAQYDYFGGHLNV